MRRLAPILVPLCFLACGQEPLTPVTSGLAFTLDAQPTWQSFNFPTFDQCTGEAVDFVTRRRFVRSTTIDADGGVHIGLHREWQGTGTGRTTGIRYILNWPNDIQLYFRGPFPETRTQRIANNLPSVGSADNRIFSLVAHYTVNAVGELTIEFGDTKLTCIG